MSFIMQPWHLLVVILASWINRHQQAVIDFQGAQIQVLMEKRGRKRILLNDDQRRRLAVKGKILGRKALRELTTIFTPDTILRWHRQLVASKWDYSQRRKANQGRPPVSEEIRHLVLRMVRENPTWGYDRIAGALANLGHEISDQTVGNTRKESTGSNLIVTLRLDTRGTENAKKRALAGLLMDGHLKRSPYNLLH